MVGTPIQLLFALGCAVVLTRVRRGAGVYRTIYYLPTMVPVVAATLGFVFLLNPAGPINHILGFFHLPEPLWFQDPKWAKPGLVLLGLWGIGNTMIIFLASLLDVPQQLYEAADIEGAGAVAALPAHHAADDLAGHLLLDRDRRDLRLPVLHRGVHRLGW